MYYYYYHHQLFTLQLLNYFVLRVSYEKTARDNI